MLISISSLGSNVNLRHEKDLFAIFTGSIMSAVFFHGYTALVGLGFLCEVPRTHSDTPHSIGLHWTSKLPVAETYN
jgi:hypothetical protein